MKKLLLLSLLFCAFFQIDAHAQKRTKITNEVSIVRYGNTTVIEDDKNQRTWTISIEREQKSTGEWIYYVACENKYTKTVAKYALSGAVASAVSATGVGSFGAGVAAKISSVIYDDVCDYFGEK